MSSVRARVVLLTGEPGSGKTTLGLALSERLRLPFLARDHVRRALWLTSGSLPSRKAATDIFLVTVEAIAKLGVSCIVEYVVRATQPEDLERLLAAADCVVVRTSCSDAVARRVTRDRGDDAREAHNRAVSEAMLVDFPVPVLDVRTDEGYDPPLEHVMAWVTGDSAA